MGREWTSSPAGRRRARIVLAAMASLLVMSAPAGAMPRSEPALAGPDLVPISGIVDPEVPEDGHVVHVSVRIENRGDAVAEAATISLVDERPTGDVVTIGSTPLPAALPPGESEVVPLPPFLAVGIGEHVLTIAVTDVTPGESDASDNTLTIPLPVEAAKVPPTQPPEPRSLWLELSDRFEISLVVATAMAVALVSAYALRSRIPRDRRPSHMAAPRGPLDPPAPDPPDRSPPPIWPL